MYTLALATLCLYLYGWYRTLAIFLALIGTIVALVLTAIVAGLMTVLLWPEQVKQITLPAFWFRHIFAIQNSRY